MAHFRSRQRSPWLPQEDSATYSSLSLKRPGGRAAEATIETYADADFAKCPTTKKFTSAYVAYDVGGMIVDATGPLTGETVDGRHIYCTAVAEYCIPRRQELQDQVS